MEIAFFLYTSPLAYPICICDDSSVMNNWVWRRFHGWEAYQIFHARGQCYQATIASIFIWNIAKNSEWNMTKAYHEPVFHKLKNPQQKLVSFFPRLDLSYPYWPDLITCLPQLNTHLSKILISWQWMQPLDHFISNLYPIESNSS